METTEREKLARLIRGGRWAALATYGDGAPLASMAAYACEPGFAGFLLHLSRLSAHTRNLLRPRPPRSRSASRTRLEFAIPKRWRGSASKGEARPLSQDRGDSRKRNHSTKNGSPIRPPSSDSEISSCSASSPGRPALSPGLPGPIPSIWRN